MNKVVIVIIAFIAHYSSIAQLPSGFYGEWKVESYTNDSTWKLKKTSKDTVQFRDWGKFFTFNEDGTYSEYASAPCGLDDNHYRYTGKWKYNPEKEELELYHIKVLNDRPQIYHNYKVTSYGKLKVSCVKKGTMEVNIITPWEKTSPKNN